MDSIEPILPHPSILPEVRALQRSEPIHRDGHRRDGQGGQGRRRDEEEAVEVDVEGVDDGTADGDGSVIVTEPEGPHRIDLTADEDGDTPTRRIDLTADGEPEPPARRIDLSA